jgi:hypothetical protein
VARKEGGIAQQEGHGTRYLVVSVVELIKILSFKSPVLEIVFSLNTA